MTVTGGQWLGARRGLGVCVLVLAVVLPVGALQSPSAGAPAPVAEPAPPAQAQPGTPRPVPPAPRQASGRQRERKSPRARAAAPALTIEQEDALLVLDGLADQARTIDDTATRIRVEGRVAELLYERHADRGRALFRRAFDEVEALNESAVDPAFAPVGARLNLRVELLATLYRVDPVLANELAATLDEDPENFDGGGMPYETQSDLSATMVRVAQSLASQDPRLAAQLARQGLATGIPVEFAVLLPELASANRAVADDLAREAIQVAGSSGLSPIDVAGALSYVFPEADGFGLLRAGPPTDSPELRRTFLFAAFAVTSRYANGLGERAAASPDAAAEPWSIYTGEGLAVNYEIAEQIAPLFDQVDPERSAAFRGLTMQIASAMPVELRTSIVTSLPSRGAETAETVAAKAEAAPNVVIREDLYSRAASLAADRGDVELARTYAGRIEDPARRQSARSSVAQQAIRAALNENRFDDARRFAADIADLRTRAAAYTQIAGTMVAAGRRPLAADCLDDAQRLIVKDGAVMTREKAEALVRVANALAPLDATRGFEAMRQALDAVNTGLRRVDGAPQTGVRRNPGTVYQLGALDPSSGLEALARTDYFRSMGLAQRLDSRALSLLAQLGAVRSALRPRMASPAVAPAPATSAKADEGATPKPAPEVAPATPPEAGTPVSDRPLPPPEAEP